MFRKYLMQSVQKTQNCNLIVIQGGLRKERTDERRAAERTQNDDDSEVLKSRVDHVLKLL